MMADVQNVKAAIRRAMDFVLELYEGQSLKELALEEVQLSDDERYWLITVGFRSFSPHLTRSTSGGGISDLIQPPTVERMPRDYKQVWIDTETGEPLPRLVTREL